jgi:Ser/Thr protein kinase RdoA (MazF antagonist)
MMKLRLMKKVVETIDDNYRSPLADLLVSRWKHAPGTAKFIRASANTVFVFKDNNKPYFLRCAHTTERTREYIQGELAFIKHLAAEGMRVANPVPSLNGNDVESVETMHGVFHAVVFEALEGQHQELDELSHEKLMLWGKTLGHLHCASQSYAPENRPSWRDHLSMIADNVLPEEETARQELEWISAQVQKLSFDETNFGLIHFDGELDNIVWNGNGNHLGLIDFDDSACYWFVADIAFALRDLFEDRADRIDLNDVRFQAFIEGYRQVRPLTDETLSNLPLFLRMHNLIMFAKIRYSLGQGDYPDEPSWLVGLRQKLNGMLNDYRQGFLAYPRAQ